MFYPVYVSHPYGGKKANKEDAALIAAGIDKAQTGEYEIVNPLALLAGAEETFSENFITRWAAGILKSCRLVVFCPGWEKSRGCRYEHFIAKRHGIPRIYLDAEQAEAYRISAREAAA